MKTYDLLNQSRVWINGIGDTLRLLEDMHPAYRDNVMHFLLRHSAWYEVQYSIQELVSTGPGSPFAGPVPDKYMPELLDEWSRKWENRYKHRHQWMRSTVLYQALYRLNYPDEYRRFLDHHPSEANRLHTLHLWEWRKVRQQQRQYNRE